MNHSKLEKSELMLSEGAFKGTESRKYLALKIFHKGKKKVLGIHLISLIEVLA